RFATGLGRPYFLDLMLPAVIPTLRDLARMRFRSQWVAFMDEIIEARLRAPPQGKPRDLFAMLLAAREPETGEAFSRAKLRDQMATMIVAGHETTALTLFWSLYLLASSPAEQERVADEVRNIDLAPDSAADALAKLPYTKAVVNEALRLYPPAFALARMAIAPDRLGDVDVPRGALVMMSPWVLHRHLRLWKEPDAFNPSRFLGEAPLAHRFAHMPFGAGPRICIGAQLALTEACLVLATLIQRFRVALADATPVLPVAVIVTQPDHAAPFRLRSSNCLEHRRFPITRPLELVALTALALCTGASASAAALSLDNQAKLIGNVDAYAPRISEVALKIWAAPELGYQETKTTALLQDELRNAGFAI